MGCIITALQQTRRSIRPSTRPSTRLATKLSISLSISLHRRQTLRLTSRAMRLLSKQTLRQRIASDHQFIILTMHIHAHLPEHIQYSRTPVALLIGQTAQSCNTARTLAEGRQHRNYRKQVRTIGRIHTERPERSTLNRDITLRAIHLRKTRTGIHQYIHYRKVSLQGCCIKSRNLHLSEHRPCNKEIRSSAPIRLQIHIHSLESLPALDLEHNLRAKRPISVRLQEIAATKHLVADLDTELLEDFKGNKYIWYALGVLNHQSCILFCKRKGHQKACNKLGAMSATDFHPAASLQRTCNSQRNAHCIVRHLTLHRTPHGIQYLSRTRKRTLKQSLLACNLHRTIMQLSHERNHHPRQQSRLPHMNSSATISDTIT